MTTDDHATLLAAALASLDRLPRSQREEVAEKLRKLAGVVAGVMEPVKAKTQNYQRKRSNG